MAAQRMARSVRSSAPAQTSRRPETPGVQPQARPQRTRPQLRVIEGSRADAGALRVSLPKILAWVRARSAPMVHVAVAIAFLVATLLGALALRTAMVQHSFEMSALESSISTLSQDVEEDQAKLDNLESSLPQKATDMGMAPQSSPLSIDLNGYQPSDASGAQGGAQ